MYSYKVSTLLIVLLDSVFMILSICILPPYCIHIYSTANTVHICRIYKRILYITLHFTASLAHLVRCLLHFVVPVVVLDKVTFDLIMDLDLFSNIVVVISAAQMFDPI